MHWVDVVAEKLLAKGKNHTIASGTSISGMIHIGNAGDVIMADAIRRAVNEKGGNAKLIWIMDDMDPLRKVPPQLPPEFKKFIGAPVSDLPWDDKENFVQHSIKPFIASLAKMGVKPEIISGTTMYKSGQYAESARIAIEKADRVRQIFKEISGAEKPADWLPFDPICPKCGKIATTDAIEYKDGKVHYICRGGVAGKERIEGCGDEGWLSLDKGKLTWRVEWPARWKILGVTCEPFGKEHSASGGSYDTCKIIVKEIFGYDPPEPVLYEHILVDGQKMSKSLGNIVTLEEMLEVVKPEILRFFFFRTKATKHKDFNIKTDILPMVEEYEHVERLYFGIEQPSPAEDLAEMKRIYEFAQIEKAQKEYFQVPYRHLATIMQIRNDPEFVAHKLGISADKIPALEEEMARLSAWLSKYAGDDVRFEVQKAIPKEAVAKLDAAQKEILSKIADKVATNPSAEELHNFIYQSAKDANIPPQKVFEAIYGLLINKQRGPRAAAFLLALDREFVVKRLKMEA